MSVIKTTAAVGINFPLRLHKDRKYADLLRTKRMEDNQTVERSQGNAALFIHIHIVI